jgi:nucleotide-binding universal stress UspA family protein
MLERVLLPVDGSERFSETVSYVQELGRTGLQEMRLLHVEPTRGGEVEHDVADHPLLGRYRDAFAAQGWSVHAELRSGDPHQEISRCAVDMRASLVVMSTHGRSGIELVREGSVTEQVVRGSPCPVFIMHSGRADGSDAQPGHLFRRMLVPLDGSEVSAAILPCVQRFARSFETEVVLFHDERGQRYSPAQGGAGAARRGAGERRCLGETRLRHAPPPDSRDPETHRRVEHRSGRHGHAW